MKRMLLAPLMLVSGAHAQTWTWLADVSDDVIEPGESVTVTLSAFMEHDTPFVALSAFIADVLIQSGAESGHLDEYEWLNDLNNDLIITLDDDSFYQLAGGQLTVFGPFTSDNPIDVFQFTWTATAPGDVTYATNTHIATIWAGEDHESATAVDVEVLHEVMFGWTVVPAPGVVLIVVGALAPRRRR